jgi:hypothetical protein
MNKKTLYALGLLTFLLAISAINPVLANDWGSPLATDPSGDGIDPGEDIHSVDARYANEFVYFRFKMNEYLQLWNFYQIWIDFDQNATTGYTHSPSDIGCEFVVWAVIEDLVPSIGVDVCIEIVGDTTYYVLYNMTANNGTAIESSPDPSVQPYISLNLFSNSSQGDIIYGFNWTWITQLMALQGFEGDNCSMFLEFEAGLVSDWCPDRTGNATDYIAWDINAGTGGIPGFPITFSLLSLLTFLGATILLHRNRIKF